MLRKLALSLLAILGVAGITEAILMICGAPVIAQVSNPGVIAVGSAPSTCYPVPLYEYQAGSTLYISGPGNTCVALGSGGSSGFPIIIGSTSIASGSTTTTIAGLTLTSPTLTTPALGTPASGVITNLTGTCTACTANSATSVPAANVAAGTLAPGMTILAPAVLGMNAEYSNGTCTTAKTISPTNGNAQNVTLTQGDNCALTFTQPSSGGFSITLKVFQSTTTPYNGTLSGCTHWQNKTPITVTAATGAIDIMSIYLDGTVSWCGYEQNF